MRTTLLFHLSLDTEQNEKAVPTRISVTDFSINFIFITILIMKKRIETFLEGIGVKKEKHE